VNPVAWFFVVWGFACVLAFIGVRGLVLAPLGRSSMDPRLATLFLIAGLGFGVMAFIGLWVAS
jgi:hypothetical protein